ncbi:hypothetical protein HK104_009509 [Borealophlyctis nickersoniae]|nr:hypothetical protein HK104_009509 [Borealophlyctis nickersoniae]
MRSVLIALASVALFASNAHAHATIQPPVGIPGSTVATALRVPHGCNGTATNNVTLTIPDNVTSVKPRAVAGWTLSITTRPLVPPVQSESGAMLNTTVDTITWSGGNLPDAWYEDFSFQFKAPTGADGTVIYFPVFQQCVEGSYNWSAIPSGPNAAVTGSPAPKFTLMTNGTMLKANGSSASGLPGSGSTTGQNNGATGVHAGAVGAIAAFVGAAMFML